MFNTKIKYLSRYINILSPIYLFTLFTFIVYIRMYISHTSGLGTKQFTK